MSDSLSNRPLTLGSHFRLDTPDRQLMQLWRQGKRPNLDEFVSQVGPLDAEQFVAVQAVDQWERWSHGERVLAETYLAAHAARGVPLDQSFELIYGEYLLREKTGEVPSLTEFEERFPEHSTALSRQVELHRAMQLDEANRLSHPGTSSELSLSGSSVSDVSKAPPGTLDPPVLPGYEILRELGRGSMGVVYQACQIHLSRMVAIKVVRPDQLLQKAAFQRLRREAQATARLTHPNLVTVYDAGVAQDTFYMVMEFVEGTDLQRLVDRSGPLAVPLACDFVRQAALGLQHAFENGVVHRDIKPSNLIAAKADAAGRSVVKILDLGLARVLEAAEEDSNRNPLTREGVFLGTPDYVAPEQGEDSRKVDIRGDLYSLGCTFYFLLTGSVPFPDCSPLEKLYRHRMTEALPVEQFNPAVPPELAAIVRRLMAKRPEYRYATPDALAEALSRLALPAAGPTPLLGAEAPKKTAPGTVIRLGSQTMAGALDVDSQSGLGRPIDCLVGHGDWVKGVAFDPVRNQLASAGLDGTLRLWNLQNGKEVRKFEGHAGAVLSLAFSADGRKLASGGVDQTIRIWDAETGEELRRCLGHTDQVNSVVLSRDSGLALSSGHDRTIRLWDAVTGQELKRLEGHSEPIWNAVFGPDESTVFSGSRDRTLRLWDLGAGREMRRIGRTSNQLLAVALSPNGRLALTGNADASVSLWDVERNQEVRVLRGHSSRVTSVAFAPDGRSLLSGSRDFTLRHWEVESGRPLATYEGHSNWITSLAFSADGRRAASGSTDATVRLWNLG